MKCMCLPKLLDFLDGLEAQALDLQQNLIPNLPAIPQLPEAAGLTQMAGGLASLSQVSGMPGFGQLPDLAGMASGLQLPAAPDLSKLESMAQVASGFGLDMQSADASMQLSLAVGSLNVNAPSLKRLEELVPPLLGPLADLQSIAVTVDSVEASFGVNLLTGGAMPELAKGLSAFDVSGVPALDPSALGDLATLGRLANASAALGVDLNSVGGFDKLQGLIDQTSKLEVPPLTLTPPELSNLIGLMSALGAVNNALSTNLMAPNAVSQMAASLPTLEANLNQFEANLTAPALPTVPEMPGLPGGAGGLPEMPGLPGKPEMPGMPEKPSMPQKPAMPGLPTGGGMPSMPGKPSMPSTPSLPTGGSLGAPGGGLPQSLGLSSDKTAMLASAAQLGSSLAGAAPAMGMNVQGLAGGLPSVDAPSVSLPTAELPTTGLPAGPPGMPTGLPSGGLTAPEIPTVGPPQFGLPAGGLPLGNLPNMDSLALAATFCDTFEGTTGVSLPTTMPACPNMFCIAKR